MYHRINVKYKTVKFLEDNIEENLDNLGCGLLNDSIVFYIPGAVLFYVVYLSICNSKHVIEKKHLLSKTNYKNPNER